MTKNISPITSGGHKRKDACHFKCLFEMRLIANNAYRDRYPYARFVTFVLRNRRIIHFQNAVMHFK